MSSSVAVAVKSCDIMECSKSLVLLKYVAVGESVISVLDFQWWVSAVIFVCGPHCIPLHRVSCTVFLDPKLQSKQCVVIFMCFLSSIAMLPSDVFVPTVICLCAQYRFPIYVFASIYKQCFESG